MNLSFLLRPGISSLEVENIRNSVGYLDESILSYSVSDTELTLKLKAGFEQKGLERKVNELLEKVSDQDSRPEISVLFDRTMAEVPFNRNDTFERLKASSQVFEHAPGVFTLRGTFLRLCDQLDLRIKRLANEFQAENLAFPVLVSRAALGRGRILEASPQYASFVAPLGESQENIVSFKVAQEGDAQSRILPFLREPDSMCRHAICTPSYEVLSNHVYPVGWSAALTSVGKVFRNEIQLCGLERLREFTMREIIFFGSQSYVKTSLMKCQAWVEEVIRDLNLRGAIRTAADPFFMDNRQFLQLLQLGRHSKIEGVLTGPKRGTEVAFASMNEHGVHFTEPFGITSEDGAPIYSGCMGVGFERLIFMIMSQYGLEISDWPPALRGFFFDH